MPDVSQLVLGDGRRLAFDDVGDPHKANPPAPQIIAEFDLYKRISARHGCAQSPMLWIDRRQIEAMGRL